jgi:hypothetical protein
MSRGILSEFNEIGGCEIRGSMQFRCGLNMYEMAMTRWMVKMRRSWDIFCGLKIEGSWMTRESRMNVRRSRRCESHLNFKLG